MKGLDVYKALAHESRVAILELLASGDKNINEICGALGLGQPTVTRHIQQLEGAGLVASEYVSAQQGTQKRCRLSNDRLIVSFEPIEERRESVVEVSMPIGLFTLANATVPCGLANREGYIGFLDQPHGFFEPERVSAQILWMAGGFVEYVFPSRVPFNVTVDRLELTMEVCSEAPDYNENWPSDLTVWVNGVDLGSWTSPGDFGVKRGVLNPDWWQPRLTQHGLFKIWSVDGTGSYVDGQPISDVPMSRLMVMPGQPISIRLGVRPDAANQGGFNLFGSGFGNYAQDLVLRLHCTPSVPNSSPSAVRRNAQT